MGVSFYSMLNLMEGIIPEFDRKGKVDMTGISRHLLLADVVIARYEVPLDLHLRASSLRMPIPVVENHQQPTSMR